MELMVEDITLIKGGKTMNLLVKDNIIIVAAPNISFGVFDEAIEKWRIADEENNLMCYWIDGGFQLVENVELPSDYVDGKYYFENSEFVINEEWEPNRSPEERISALEAENARLKESVEMQAEVLDFLLMQ